jgi:transcriptional regulator
MYRPQHFAWNDLPSQLAFCRAHAFATVVTTGASRLEAQHLPLLIEVEAGRMVLRGHAAVGNPMCQAGHALAVFSGPHAYISAAWYDAADTVPTWNYLAVHVAGPLSLITDPAEVRGCFARLGAADPQQAEWTERLSDATYARLAAGVRWFRIDAERIEGKAKLSQNHSPERQQRVIAQLAASSSDATRATAAAMTRTLHGDTPWPTTEIP